MKDEIGDPAKLYWNPIRNSDLTWNFDKFLIRPDGTPYKRYDATVTPPEIMEDIQTVLEDYYGEQELSLTQSGGLKRNTLSVKEQFKRLYDEFKNTEH